jgi:nicotinamide mononucleotide adenylyltransferase
MSQFSDLLRKAAAEVRHYCTTAPDVKQSDIDWLLSLAQQMDVASALEGDAEVERQIDTLHYSIIDSGPLPLTVRFAPSFDRAVDALQRRRKRESQK